MDKTVNLNWFSLNVSCDTMYRCILCILENLVMVLLILFKSVSGRKSKKFIGVQ